MAFVKYPFDFDNISPIFNSKMMPFWLFSHTVVKLGGEEGRKDMFVRQKQGKGRTLHRLHFLIPLSPLALLLYVVDEKVLLDV